MRYGIVGTLFGVLILAASLATAQDISREDSLALENLALKIKLHEARVQALQREVQQAAKLLEYERGILEKAIQEKYGVSLGQIERQGDKWVVKAPEPPVKEGSSVPLNPSPGAK